MAATVKAIRASLKKQARPHLSPVSKSTTTASAGGVPNLQRSDEAAEQVLPSSAPLSHVRATCHTRTHGQVRGALGFSERSDAPNSFKFDLPGIGAEVFAHLVSKFRDLLMAGGSGTTQQNSRLPGLAAGLLRSSTSASTRTNAPIRQADTPAAFRAQHKKRLPPPRPAHRLGSPQTRPSPPSSRRAGSSASVLMSATFWA